MQYALICTIFTISPHTYLVFLTQLFSNPKRLLLGVNTFAELCANYVPTDLMKFELDTTNYHLFINCGVWTLAKVQL